MKSGPRRAGTRDTYARLATAGVAAPGGSRHNPLRLRQCSRRRREGRVAERGDGVWGAVRGAGMTRGRFLAALALAGVAGGGVLGCGAVGRVRSLYPPRPNGGEWAFRSRPDLRPPAVSGPRGAPGTARGWLCRAT